MHISYVNHFLACGINPDDLWLIVSWPARPKICLRTASCGWFIANDTTSFPLFGWHFRGCMYSPWIEWNRRRLSMNSQTHFYIQLTTSLAAIARGEAICHFWPPPPNSLDIQVCVPFCRRSRQMPSLLWKRGEETKLKKNSQNLPVNKAGAYGRWNLLPPSNDVWFWCHLLIGFEPCLLAFELLQLFERFELIQEANNGGRRDHSRQIPSLLRQFYFMG